MPFTTDILIRTYPGDYCWLWHCLKQIERHARGFRNIHIVVPQGKAGPLSVLTKEIVHECPCYQDDYLGQQVTKMRADVYSDADFIMHIDSDVMLMRDTVPEDFIENGRAVLYHEPYEKIESPWQSVIAEVLGYKPSEEFMRRHPFMYPRWLYSETRAFIENRHGVDFETYVISRPYRQFTEFNALGAYAWKYRHGDFSWRLPDEGPVHAKQFWSWGGIEIAAKELEELKK